MLEERVIQAHDIAELKPAWHRERLNVWAEARGIDPALAWRAREACILALSENATT